MKRMHAIKGSSVGWLLEDKKSIRYFRDLLYWCKEKRLLVSAHKSLGCFSICSYAVLTVIIACRIAGSECPSWSTMRFQKTGSKYAPSRGAARLKKYSRA